MKVEKACNSVKATANFNCKKVVQANTKLIFEIILLAQCFMNITMKEFPNSDSPFSSQLVTYNNYHIFNYMERYIRSKFI